MHVGFSGAWERLGSAVGLDKAKALAVGYLSRQRETKVYTAKHSPMYTLRGSGKPIELQIAANNTNCYTTVN